MALSERMRDWLDRRDGLVAIDEPAPVEVDDALARKRERLSEEVAQAQFDLGGLAYEMAIRDHFALDVLLKRAATLQELDGELGEVERLIALRDGGAAGACRGCGALHSRGAVFCWQCGGRLLADRGA